MSNKKKDYNFTAYPNYIIEEVMPHIDGNTFKVLSLIVRNTMGHHKKYDKIALSQFEEETGLSRNTVLKALNNLNKHRIIEKFDGGIINRYRIILPKEVSGDYHKSNTNHTAASSNIEHPSSNNEPAPVHTLNPKPVQTLNTQKKPIKENEINSSTTTKKDDVEQIVEAWNSKFNISVNPINNTMLYYIGIALNELKPDEIIQAMDNRLSSPYYKKKKPELLHQPGAFFKYIDTIKTDLQRTPKHLYTHREYVDLINKGYKGEQFIVRRDVRDQNGNPMKELISKSSAN